ncbi:MAG: T9SS type A sorting domain-containing protein [Ignavibacteriaceae bacterium]
MSIALALGPPAPTTLSPTIGFTGQDTNSVTFQWNHTAVTNDTAKQWILEISTSSIFSGPDVYLSGTLTDTIFIYSVPGTLNPGTPYYWRVIASDGFNSSPYSDTANFTTNYVPTASALNITGNLTVGSTITGNYTYSDADGDLQGASTFQWYRATDAIGTGSTPIGGATSQTYTLVHADSSFYISFQVVPVAQTGSSPGAAVLLSNYSGSITGFVVSAPTVPVLGYPPDSTWRMPDSLTFTWSNPGNQDSSFEIQITQDPTFYSTEIDSAGITDTSYTVIHSLLLGGSPADHYYWRVQGRNSKGTSTWTSPNVFNVTINGVKGPQIPHLDWPIDSSDVYNDTTNLVWNYVYRDTSLVFDVVMARDSGYTRGVQTYNSLHTTSILVDTLISDSTYYWKVRSRDTVHADTSNYSASAVFHVSQSSTLPVLAWPIGGGSVYQISQTFSWYLNGIAPAIVFDFILSRNSNLSSPDTIATNLSTRFVTYYHLRSGQTYYWRVVSTIPGGHKDSSAIATFVVVPNAGPVPPTLGWPVGGDSVYTNFPTLVWSINSTGLGLSYDVQYSLSKANLNSSTVYTTTNLYYSVLAPLLSDTMYYWQVRSKNGTDSSAYSPVDSFMVAAGSGNPVVPIPSAPIHGDSVHSNYPTFSWYLNVASAGLYYDIKYSRTIGGLSSATIVPAGSGNSYTSLTPFPVDTIYFWQVRSRSAYDTSNFCNPDSFWVVTGSGNPIIPIPSWPIGGITVEPNPPVLNWYLNASPQGLLYKVQYTTDTSNNFSTYTEHSGIDTNSYQIPSALPIGITYYWRVLSYDTTTHDSSGWSPVVTFVTPAFLSAAVPHVASPINGVRLLTTSPMLTWYIPTVDTSITSYDVQYSTSSNFSGAVTIPNLSKTNKVISSLQPGQLYYWRVRSSVSNGSSSSYSYSGNFYTAGVTGVKNGQVVPYTFKVEQNYPNPFNPSTQIQYSIPKESMVSIKVYNVLGQLINTLVDERKVAGSYSVQWNGDNFHGQPVATGVYIYRVTAGENVAVKKMVLLK